MADYRSILTHSHTQCVSLSTLSLPHPTPTDTWLNWLGHLSSMVPHLVSNQNPWEGFQDPLWSSPSYRSSLGPHSSPLLTLQPSQPQPVWSPALDSSSVCFYAFPELLLPDSYFKTNSSSTAPEVPNKLWKTKGSMWVCRTGGQARGLNVL